MGSYLRGQLIVGGELMVKIRYSQKLMIVYYFQIRTEICDQELKKYPSKLKLRRNGMQIITKLQNVTFSKCLDV